MTRKRLGRYIVPLLGVPCIVIGQWSSTRCFAQQPQIYRLPPVEDDRWTSIESLIPYDQSESAVNTKKQSVAQPGSFQLQGPQSPQPAITVNPRDRGATYPQSAPESVARRANANSRRGSTDRRSLTPPKHIPRVDPSVVKRSSQLIDDAVRLADRGAAFSARAQLVKSMRLIAQSLDAESESDFFSLSLAYGFQALEEATDFAPQGTEFEANLDIAKIVAGHRTPVLKGDSRVTALGALQIYHAYAEDNLAAACGKELVAANAIVALAKLQPLLVSQDADITVLALPRSMSLYQAALLASPQNYLAANELGVLFARFGQLEDARDVLTHCVETDPSRPVGWKNLASVHRHLGEHQLAMAATEEWQIATNNQQTPDRKSAVEWVPPEKFARSAPVLTDAAESPVPKSAANQARSAGFSAARPSKPKSKASSKSWMSRVTSIFHRESPDKKTPRR